MVNKKKTVILRLAEFFEIPITDDIIERVIERTSFSFMKKHEKKFGEQPQTNDNRIYDKFIRKGKVGVGKSYFTNEQSEKYYELANKYLENNDVAKRYFKRG